jgi:hypothetical protein
VRPAVRHPFVSLLAAAGASLVCLGDARPSEADAKFAERGYEIELGAKAGFVSAPTPGYVSPFGLGFGGRLGASFSGVYVGVSVVDFLGGSDGTITESSILYGGEIGFGFRIHDVGGGSITIRPQVGVGVVNIERTDSSKVDIVTTASGRTATSGQSTTVSNVYLEPGLSFMYASGANFFALNAGALIVPGLSYDANGSQTWISYGGRAEAGFRF